MSFLVPVVLGGGPNILRGTQARMDRGSALRAVLINAGLLVWILAYALPIPGQVQLLVSVLVLGAFAAFLPLLAFAVLYAVRAKRAGRLTAADRSPMPKHVPEPAAVTRRRHTSQAAVALALVLLAVAVGMVLAR